MAEARRQGCPTLNGLSMLLYQGALAFERWVGRGTPIGAMPEALGLS
jgi:shikimate dehydrogenase